MSPVDMNGFWKMTSNENFDEYMEALGRLIFHFRFIHSLYTCEIKFLCWTRYVTEYILLETVRVREIHVCILYSRDVLVPLADLILLCEENWYHIHLRLTNFICIQLTDVNIVIRKIASYLIFDKEIVQNGDHFNIKTLTTFRNYQMEFDVGKEFEEDLGGVDDRKCKVSDLLIYKGTA